MSVDLAVKIAVADIVIGNNDRKVFDPVALGELAHSIVENGLLEEPIFRPIGDGKYELVAGERRLRAMRDILGWDEIPGKVRSMDDDAAASIMFAENFHRVQLSPIEEAGAYRKWMNQFGWDYPEIALKAKVSVARVQSRMRLLELIDDLQFMVNAGELPIGHAAWLVPLDADRQRMALRAFRDDPSILDRARFKALADDLFHQQSVEPLFAMEVAEWSAPVVEVAAKPVSRKGALSLIERLADALGSLDPDDPLVAEAAGVLAAEVEKKSQSARKAHATRRVQAAAR